MRVFKENEEMNRTSIFRKVKRFYSNNSDSEILFLVAGELIDDNNQ